MSENRTWPTETASWHSGASFQRKKWQPEGNHDISPRHLKKMCCSRVVNKSVFYRTTGKAVVPRHEFKNGNWNSKRRCLVSTLITAGTASDPVCQEQLYRPWKSKLLFKIMVPAIALVWLCGRPWWVINKHPVIRSRRFHHHKVGETKVEDGGGKGGEGRGEELPSGSN